MNIIYVCMIVAGAIIILWFLPRKVYKKVFGVQTYSRKLDFQKEPVDGDFIMSAFVKVRLNKLFKGNCLPSIPKVAFDLVRYVSFGYEGLSYKTTFYPVNGIPENVNYYYSSTCNYLNGFKVVIRSPLGFQCEISAELEDSTCEIDPSVIIQEFKYVSLKFLATEDVKYPWFVFRRRKKEKWFLDLIDAFLLSIGNGTASRRFIFKNRISFGVGILISLIRFFELKKAIGMPIALW